MVVRDDILPESLTAEQGIVVQSIVSSFTDSFSSSETYHSVGERSRQPKPAQDIDGFTDLAMRVIEEQQISEDVPLKNRISFLQDFSPRDITTEVISFGLLHRLPSSMSQGQHFNQKRRELKPFIRGLEDDPTRPGYKVITLGQRFENELVFTCWAKTNKAANRRARWLEDTLRDWTWYIRHEGVHDFYFLGQDEDVVLKIDGTNNVLKGRPMRYYVRTERLSHVLEPTIRRIVVKYKLGQPYSTAE
jgi:hypothetical protein